MKTNEQPIRIYNCVVRLEKKVFWPSFSMALIIIGVGLYFSIALYWLGILCFPILLAGIAILWWPVIEPTNGILRERALLFGHKNLKEKTTPLNEFVEIFYERFNGDVGDSNFRLGLLHKTGRKIWVGGNWAIQRSVEETAWQISCDTGIKIRDEKK
jgi:hypothetical protein